MDHVGFRRSFCGVSFGTVRITDLDFANETVILSGPTEALAGAVDLLSEGAETLGNLWIKTKVQAFDDILDTTHEPFPLSGGNVDVSQTFTYLGSVIHSSNSSPILVEKDDQCLPLAGSPGVAVFL